METVFPFLRHLFFLPLIHNIWLVGCDYALLLDLRGFVVSQNLIIMCIFVETRTIIFYNYENETLFVSIAFCCY